MSARIAIVIVLLAGCDDDQPTVPCPGGCDDFDPCTIDECSSGGCTNVPVDAQNACRTDRHCDDAIACSVDTCAVDSCGFQRCRHEFPSGCQPCTSVFECGDGDPCTADVCRSGLCERPVSELCDRGCDPNGETAPEFVRLIGRVEPVAPCTCPCTTAAMFAGHPLLTSPDAECILECVDNDLLTTCSPMPAGVVWSALGTFPGGVPGPFVPHSWCMDASMLSGDFVQWRGTLTWSGQPASDTTFDVTTQFGGFNVFNVDCGSCVIRLEPNTSFVSNVGEMASTVDLFISQGGRQRSVRVTLYPSDIGFAGPALSTDDDLAPLDGVMVLRLPGLP